MLLRAEMVLPLSEDVKKFTWRIEKFSSLKDARLYSDIFLVGGYKWRILLLPMDTHGYLSVCLDFADSETMPRGWSVAADFTMTLVNQTNGIYSVKWSSKENFEHKATVKPVGGCIFCIKIRDYERQRFLVEDTIIIETEVRIVKEKVDKYGDRVLQTIEATIRDYHKKYGSDNRDNGIDNCLSLESQQQGDQQVIEPEMVDQSHGHSASPSLPNKVARTTTITSPSCSSVQLTSKNLIAELSTMAGSWNSTSVGGISLSRNVANDGPALLQQQREKLAKFFEMPVNEICKANRFDNVQEVVLKTHELATVPSEKSVLKDLMSRLVEFRNTTPESVSIFESSREVETSAAQKMKELKGSLLQRQKQLTFLDSEDSRIAEEKMKVEAEIQLLVLLRDKLGNEKKTTEAEMEVANREVSRELEELKSKQTEHSQAKGSRLRAKERLAQDNGLLLVEMVLKLTKQFTWRVEDWKYSTSYSKPFLAGDHKCRFVVFPKTDYVRDLYVYLDLVDSKTTPNYHKRGVPAEIKLTLCSFYDDPPVIRKGSTHNWGLKHFGEMKLLDCYGRLLGSDLVFECRVYTELTTSEAASYEDSFRKAVIEGWPEDISLDSPYCSSPDWRRCLQAAEMGKKDHRVATDKFKWRVEKFSKQEQNMYSDTFIAGGHKWRFVAFPKGYRVCYLYVYLELVDSETMPSECSAVISLTLVNQRKGSLSVETSACIHDWNLRYFTKRVELARKGFLVNDILIFEAEVSTFATTPKAATNELKRREGVTMPSCSIPRKATNVWLTNPPSAKNKELGVSKDAGNLQVIEPEVDDRSEEDSTSPPSSSKVARTSSIVSPGSLRVQLTSKNLIEDSTSPPLSSKVARTSNIMSPGSSRVQLTSKNLIAELSNMASSLKSTSIEINLPTAETNDGSHGSASLPKQREKLAKFFEMSLEAVSQSNRFDEIRQVVLKISELTADPFEKTLLKDLLSRLNEFKNRTSESLSIIGSSHEVEASTLQTTTKLEGSLVQRQNQLTFLDAKALRIEGEKMKVEAEIRQLVARKDKLVREEKLVLAELEVANREASREVEGLKRKQREHEHARKNRLRAKERLAKNNVSWKLFKDNLGL
ncbi:Ubiquitin C-terminal hydrolase 13 [Linum perenne]